MGIDFIQDRNTALFLRLIFLDLQDYMLESFPKGELEKDIADAVDFVLEQALPATARCRSGAIDPSTHRPTATMLSEPLHDVDRALTRCGQTES